MRLNNNKRLFAPVGHGKSTSDQKSPVSTLNQPAYISEFVHINCSGFEYITTEETLQRFPESLLGDAEQREKFFTPSLQCYYFDRHRTCFESILQFYQTGVECPPPYIDLNLYRQEKQFFGLKKSLDVALDLGLNLTLECTSKNVCCDKQTKLQIHKFLVTPPTTVFAAAYHVIDVIMIAISTLLFLLEAEPSLHDKFELRPEQGVDVQDVAYCMFALNSLAVLWFTVDLVVRMATWPVFLDYWKNIMNILDFMTVIPFYISIIEWMSESHAGSMYLALKAFRLARVARVFKFVRHSKSITVIIKALFKLRHELTVLFISLFIFVVAFGALMFYVEGHEAANPGPNQPFSSILMSCWWVLVSVTTVGFGDMYPVSVLGRLIGCFVVCFGIIFLSLPMAIIVSRFSIEFDRERSSYD